MRSIRWAPLPAAAFSAIGLLAVVRVGSPIPPAGPVAALLLTLVIAAAVYAAGDPAGELLGPLPTTARRRLVRRTCLTTVPAAVGLLTTALVGHGLYDAAWSAPGAAGLAALAVAAGVAAIAGAPYPNAPAVVVFGCGLLGFVLATLGVPRGVAFPWWI